MGSGHGCSMMLRMSFSVGDTVLARRPRPASTCLRLDGEGAELCAIMVVTMCWSEKTKKGKTESEKTGVAMSL